MARRQVQLPELPKLPESFPLEDAIARTADKMVGWIERDILLGKFNDLVERIPIVPEKSFATPWGKYKTPEVYVPKLSPPRLDDRQREAMKAAVMTDLASLVEKIPGLGAIAGPVGDSIEDTAYAKIQETLTPDENQFFRSYDKVDPLSCVAMVRTFVRTQKER